MTVITYDKDVHGQPLPHPIKFDNRLYEELSWIPKWIEDDYDYWLLIVGRNGEGKSYTAMRAATLLNRNFNIDNIVFTAQDVERAVDKSKPGDVILFDESDEIARHGASAIIQEFKRFAKRIRHKRLIIIMATTTLRDINWYFITRIRSIIYNFAGGVGDRGWYHYYTGEDQLAWLYHFATEGSKVETKSQVYDKAFSTIRRGYLGRGGDMPFHIDSKEYNDRKFEATVNGIEKGLDKQTIGKVKVMLAVNWKTNPYLQQHVKAKLMIKCLDWNKTSFYDCLEEIPRAKPLNKQDIPGEIQTYEEE